MALCVPHKHVLSTSSTSTSFTAQNATTTKPSGDAVIDLLDRRANGWGGGHDVPSWVQLTPYGTNGDNDTFDMRVYGWSKTEDATAVWVPCLLLDVSLIMCAITATPFAANTFLVDSVTLNDGFASSPQWLHIQNHSEDLAACIIMHTLGHQLLSFDFDLAGGQEGVSMNCLVRPFTIS